MCGPSEDTKVSFWYWLFCAFVVTLFVCVMILISRVARH